MAEIKKQGGKVIFATLFIALLFTILPLPEWLRAFRPEWVTMVVIYWCLALPSRVNIGVAWVMGLTVDVLTGTLLGQHALAMSIVAFFSVRLHKQIRVYPLWQQSLSVFTLVALGQLLIVWIRGISGESPDSWLYWGPSFTSALVWPIVFVFLRDIRRKFRVA